MVVSAVVIKKKMCFLLQGVFRVIVLVFNSMEELVDELTVALFHYLGPQTFDILIVGALGEEVGLGRIGRFGVVFCFQVYLMAGHVDCFSTSIR